MKSYIFKKIHLKPIFNSYAIFQMLILRVCDLWQNKMYNATNLSTLCGPTCTVPRISSCSMSGQHAAKAYRSLSDTLLKCKKQQKSSSHFTDWVLSLILSCLMTLLTLFHVSEYHNFWKTARWYIWKINDLPLTNCFSYRNILQNGVKSLSKMLKKKKRLLVVEKLKILNISDHTVWFKFRPNVVQVRIK